MNEKILYTYRLYFTGDIAIAIWSLLVCTHYNGGVQSHHLLHREELPAISNWWSGLLIPLLSWFLLYRVQKRIVHNKCEEPQLPKQFGNIIAGFIAALCYGVLIAIFFTYQFTSIPGFMLLGILLIAFLYPIHQSECILGFILGMTVTFGAFIPTLVACIFSLIGFLIYRFVRPASSFIIFKISPVFLRNKENRSNQLISRLVESMFSHSAFIYVFNDKPVNFLMDPTRKFIAKHL